ncbi:MAG: hypothetical protein LAO31_19375 [Acidobacteriia bacterium]|nr:hypothetical protein [Terriglobia bacterium]
MEATTSQKSGTPKPGQAASPTMVEAAARLGSVYIELTNLGQSLDVKTLPSWLQPPRLNPFGGRFQLGMEIQAALSNSPLYHALRSPGEGIEASLRLYEKDLQVFVPLLKGKLGPVTEQSLIGHILQLQQLSVRFSKPGIEDLLYKSVWRMLLRDRPKNFWESQSSLVYSEIAERRKWLKRIKTERDVLIREPTQGKVGAGDKPGNSVEVSELLACIAVHPNPGKLIWAYSESPRYGTELTNGELPPAIRATINLVSRLTNPKTADEALGYAPLVVGAVAQLGLQEVPGLPEFAVAMGRLLAMHMSGFEVGVSAAWTLMIGLSLVFTGPVGAVAVGSLDLALSGMGVGINLLREHEQEIAATASNFVPEEQKLAEHPSGADTALSLAGALMSAIALTGAITSLKAQRLLKTKPRSPDVVKATRVEPQEVQSARRSTMPAAKDDAARGIAKDSQQIGDRLAGARAGKSETKPLAPISEEPNRAVSQRAIAPRARRSTKGKPPKGEPPIGEYTVTELRRFGVKGRVGDPWEGHEVLLNSWLERQGLITRRGSGLSRFNSAIALSTEEHATISAMQRARGLYNEAVLGKMTAREVIEANAQILLDAGLPEERVIRVVDDTLELLTGIGGKAPL